MQVRFDSKQNRKPLKCLRTSKREFLTVLWIDGRETEWKEEDLRESYLRNPGRDDGGLG